MLYEISAFCAGYITALNTAGVEWTDWAVPLSIHCCAIDLMREGDKVRVVVYYANGLRHEFFMVERPNIFGDNEWIKE